MKRNKINGWTRWTIAALLLLVSQLALAADLAPQHEMQRLVLQAEESLEAGDIGEARQALEQARALETELLPEFYLYLGQVEQTEGNLEAARQALVEYINRAGSEAPDYRNVLRQITQLEKTPVTSVDVDQTAIPVITRTESASVKKTDNLRRLYMTERTDSALLEHINTILAANTYIPGRLRIAGEKQGLHYRLNLTTGGELTLQETDYRNKKARHTVSSIDVYGVDPYVRGDCDNRRQLCTLYHPQDRSREWMVIDNNTQALRELQEAVTALLRQVQN